MVEWCQPHEEEVEKEVRSWRYSTGLMEKTGIQTEKKNRRRPEHELSRNRAQGSMLQYGIGIVPVCHGRGSREP